MEKRVEEYNTLRMLAAILVVVGHTCNLVLPYSIEGKYFESSYFLIDNLVLANILDILKGFIYRFHMPLFVALSGSLFYLKVEVIKQDRIGYVLKRTKKLLKLYLMSSVIYIPIQFLCGRWGKNPSSICQIIKDYLLGFSPSGLWFILMLIWVTIFFTFTIKYFDSNKYKILVALMGLIILRKMSVRFGNLPFCIDDGLYYLLWFYLGILFEKYRDNLVSNKSKYYITFAFLLLFIMRLLKITKLYSLITTVVLMYVTVIITWKIPKPKSPFLRWTMNHSLELYLYHPLIRYMLIAFLQILLKPALSNLSFACIILICYILEFSGSFIITCFKDRYCKITS